MTKKTDKLTTNEGFQVKSRKKEKFTQVENEIIDCISFDYSLDKLVYICIERFNYYTEESKIKPSISTLAALCAAKSTNPIRDSIKRLVAMGLIEVEIGGRKANGEYHNNTYWLLEIPEHITINSITNPDAVDAKRERDKERKAAKRKKKEDKIVALEGTSKFEPPIKDSLKSLEGTSKNEVGGSKNEVGTSKFEGNNNTSFNTSLNTIKDSKYVSSAEPSAIASVSAANAINYFKESKGIQRLNKQIREKLEMLIANFGANGHLIVSKAITVAAEKDKLELYFIEGICNNWLKANVTSLEDIEAYTTSFKEKLQEKANTGVKQQGKQTSDKRKRSYTKNPVRKEMTPEWLKEESEKTAALTEKKEPITLDGEATADERARMEAIIAKYKR